MNCIFVCSTGLFDGPISLVAALLSFGGSSDASLEATQAGLGAAIVSVLASSKDGYRCEISPRGLLQLLEALHQLAQSHSEGPDVLLGQAVLPALLALLQERHLAALAAWPAAAGGGQQGVYQLVASVAALLQLPLNVPIGMAAEAACRLWFLEPTCLFGTTDTKNCRTAQCQCQPWGRDAILQYRRMRSML